MFEQIRISRATRGNGTDLLLLGDSTQPMAALEPLQGKAQAVYVDPPFMTGERFTRRRRFGPKGWKTGTPAPLYPSYDDRHPSREAWMAMLRGMLTNAHSLLREDGMVLLHLDWHTAHLGRLLLDEIFGADMFVNEVIWAYESGGRAKHSFSRKHDTILLYSKSKDYHFDLTRVPLSRSGNRSNHMKRAVDEDGRSYRSMKVAGKEYRYYDDEPVYPGDVWTDISHIQQRDPERTGYSTQKPQALLERLLKPLVQEGDLVADLCCGSGTALAAAEDLGCRLLGVDLNPDALLVTRARLRGEHLTLVLDSSDDPVAPEAYCDPQAGTVILQDFPAAHEAFPDQRQDALDALERWALGHLEGDVLVEECAFQRSFQRPVLDVMGMVSGPREEIAMSTVDAAGAYRVYRWRED